MRNGRMRRIVELLKLKWKKPGDILGGHCCPTGMTVSEASLSRRDQKIARLYEQGVSKERVGAYLRRRLGWAGVGVMGGIVLVGCTLLPMNLKDVYDHGMIVMIEDGLGAKDDLSWWGAYESYRWINDYFYKDGKYPKYQCGKGCVRVYGISLLYKNIGSVQVGEWKEVTEWKHYKCGSWRYSTKKPYRRTGVCNCAGRYGGCKEKVSVHDELVFLRVHNSFGCGGGRESCLVVVRHYKTKIFYRQSAEEYRELMVRVGRGEELSGGEVVY